MVEEDIEFEIPPTPPLASANINLQNNGQLDVGEENFAEGTDSKWKAYQNIRRHKRAYW